MAIDWENYGKERTQARQSSGYHARSYVDGNTVRKESAVPKKRERVRPRPEPKRYPERKPARIAGISGRAFVFLTVMVSAVTVCGFSYLSAQYEVREMKSQIVELQSEISQQKEDNEMAYEEIKASVDLAEIYERATKKLKMVQAENNQVYKYSNKKSDMVKQYADIPGAAD